MLRKAVYAGSFDPITNGHLWVIEEGAKLFDELVIAVGTSQEKVYTFTTEERVEMLAELTKQYPNVRVDSFQYEFLINYAMTNGASYLLRGIRTQSDYDYERQMRHINSDFSSDIQTVFLIPPRHIAEVSSSLIKSLVGPKGWENIIKQYAPELVCRKLADKLNNM